VQEVDLNRPLEKRPTGPSGQTNHRGTPAHPQQIGVADFIRLSVRHHQTEGLKWLRSQDVA
jgi:hypothetical protein